MHDHRMTIGRRETIKAVALLWLLIRIVLDVFNQTLHLKDMFDNCIDIPNFRGRMVIPENLRRDRPIDAPDRGHAIFFICKNTGMFMGWRYWWALFS